MKPDEIIRRVKEFTPHSSDSTVIYQSILDNTLNDPPRDPNSLLDPSAEAISILSNALAVAIDMYRQRHNFYSTDNTGTINIHE